MNLRRRSAGLAPLLLTFAGCSLVGGGPRDPGEAWEDAAARGAPRRFGGSFMAEGSRIQLILELRGPDDDLMSSLELPDLDITARGGGTLVEDRLTLQMRYDGDCPGELRVTGSVERDGYRVDGTLTATDCTGSQEGPVVLLLRPSRREARRR